MASVRDKRKKLKLKASFFGQPRAWDSYYEQERDGERIDTF